MVRFCSAVFALGISAVLLTGAPQAHQVEVKDLRILHPYTHEPTGPAPHRLAIFMTVRNTGQVADRLIGVSSPLATGAAIVGPQAGPAGSMPLPAGAETVLGPQSAFVELTGVGSDIAGYEYFSVWLHFEVAGRVEAEVYVEERR